MTFLIVDDNRQLSLSLASYIHKQGHNCVAQHDATKVEEWLGTNPCDAVVLDIAMPEIDGLSLIKVIRARHPKLPVIMFTGMGYDEELMQSARNAGANGYVSKVLGPREIYTALTRSISQHPGGEDGCDEGVGASPDQTGPS